MASLSLVTFAGRNWVKKQEIDKKIISSLAMRVEDFFSKFYYPGEIVTEMKAM